jgi:hypothetical protein
MPGRILESLSRICSAVSKFFGGGHVEKSSLAKGLMSVTVALKSLDGMASILTLAVCPA